jgi:hypothetical protein
MTIIERIKGFLRSRLLQKRLSGRKRNRVSGSLMTAAEVFVIYDASEEYQNKISEELFAELKGLDIKVKSLGYAKFKIIPHYCIPQLTRQFICKKDLNLLGIPDTPYLNDCMDEEVDLLISLDMNQDPVFQYIAAMSNAKCRVGWNDPANLPFYDILVKGKENDLGDFIRQIINYLTINNQ